MIKFGNKPSPISEETINALKLMINGVINLSQQNHL